MKRRCIDPMTDEWQEWDEPLSLTDMLDRIDRENAKTTGYIAVILVLSLFGICAAIYSMMHTPRDTEQASLDRGYVWMMEDGR